MKKFKKTKSVCIALAAAMVASAFLTACAGSPVKGHAGTSAKDEEITSKISNDISFDIYVDRLSELVTVNWPAMYKVWPGYDYTNHNFLIFYLDEKGVVKEAKLLNVNENRSLRKKEYENITPPNPEGYDQIQFQAKPSIVMSVDDAVMKAEDSVNELYKTATHEMVHFYYQKDVQTSAESSRSQIYPIEREPRILRRMIYTRLIQAFEKPDRQDEYLGKAKFRMDKYNDEYKSEADRIRATDIAEATARYTENFGIFIGKNLSQEDIRKEADKFIRKEQIFIAADKESYEIGYVAGLILDEKNPNWKENFYATGKGIPEVLLANVTPIPDELDKKIEDNITKKVNSTNKADADKLKDVITAKDNTDIPLLHLDVSKASKSFYAESMYRYQNLPVMAGYSSTFTVKGKNVEIKDTAIISGYEEEHQCVRIPLTMKYDSKGGILTIDSPPLKADGIQVKTSKENGRIIYSAEVQG